MFKVYLSRSKVYPNKTYVGKTVKPIRARLDEHNRGSNAWSKQNGPFRLVYYESFVYKEDAAKQE